MKQITIITAITAAKTENQGCINFRQVTSWLQTRYSTTVCQLVRAAHHLYTMLSRAICLLLLNLFDLTLWEFRGKAGLGPLQLPIIKRFSRLLKLPALKEPTRLNIDFSLSFNNLRMPS